MRVSKISYAIHSWTGLLTGWLLFVICLTGTLVVYKFPLKSLSNPSVIAGPVVDRIGPDGALQAFQKAYPDAQPKVIAFPSDIYSMHLYSVQAITADDKKHRYWIHPTTGAMHDELESNFADFVQNLHARLFAGKIGQWVVGFLGLAMLASLLAGLIFHWNRLRRDLFHLRLTAAPRKAWSDLHKFTGVWALPFHLIIALTGAWLGVESLIDIRASDSNPIEWVGEGRGDPRPIRYYVEQAEAQRPDFIATHINFTQYGAAGSTARVQGNVAGSEFVQRGQTMFVFDADSGRLLQTIDRTEEGLVRRILAMMRPLHYGYFWPPFGEILYFWLGLGCTALVFSAMLIWAARDRSQRRAQLGEITLLERANAGLMGGVILSLATLSVANALARLPHVSNIAHVSSIARLNFTGSQDWLQGAQTAPEIWLFFALWLTFGLICLRLSPFIMWRLFLTFSALCMLSLPILGCIGAGSFKAYLHYGGQHEAIGHALVCLVLAVVLFATRHKLSPSDQPHQDTHAKITFSRLRFRASGDP